MMFSRDPALKKQREKLPLWYRAVSVFLTVCAVAALLFCMAMMFIARSGEEGKSVFGNVVLEVLSDSMEPEFEKGDIISCREYGGEEVAAGDVIVFRASAGPYKGRAIAHRVVEVLREGEEVRYLTKGDAANNPDTAPVAASDIMAVYDKKLPLVTSVSRNMDSAAGMMLVIGLPVILTVGVFLADAILSHVLASRATEKEKEGDGASAPSEK